MKQYTFEIIDEQRGTINYVRATAATTAIARAQVVLKYAPRYDVADMHSSIAPAHHVLGEIDCSDFPLSDTAWLLRQAAQTEAA
jgi:hypothetical protein